MRIVMTLLLSLVILGACSTPVDTSPEAPVEQTSSEEKNPTDSADEMETETEQMIDKLPVDAHVEDWNLILVNPWQALPEDFEPNLTEVGNEQRIDARVVDAWNAWNQAAKDAGHRLFFASGHRTVERQRNNFDRNLQEYLDEGYSEEEALEKTKEYLTEPGHSEHHTGLALDIVDEEWIAAGNGLDPEYDTQASQQWMMDTMADYGFILRYPKGKEDITGIQYESWHFRYVGEENAKYMVEHDLVLEEYIELLNKRDERNE